MIQKKTIRELCHIIGGNPSPKENEFSKEGIPFVKMMDLGRYHLTNNLIKVENKISQDYAKFKSLKKIPKSSILLPRSGSVGLNHRAILGMDAFIVSHICALNIIDNHIVHNNYLYYYLSSIDMVSITKQTTGLDAITFEDLGKINIPLPPLETQKKIAAILDKADELRQNDKKILEKFDRLAQSIFLEMFGDPVMNEKGWGKLSLGEIASEIKYGTNAKSFDNCQEGSIPVIRIPNINFGYVNFRDLKYSTLPKKELENVRLKKGDLLFVRSNGNPDFIGRCAMFNSDFDAVFASYLIRVKVNRNISLRPDFIAYHINYKSFRRRVIREARTTAGNYNLNTAGLRSFELIIPPIELQNRFATIIEKVENQKELSQQNLQKSEDLFQSLLQRAFKGELV